MIALGQFRHGGRHAQDRAGDPASGEISDQSDEDHDAAADQRRDVAHGIDGCQHLGHVDLADHRPVHAFEAELAEDGEHRDAAIVEDLHRPAFAVQRSLDGFAVDLRLQDGRLLGKAGVAAHQVVGAHEIGLAALAHAGGRLHDLVDPGDRHLEYQHAEHLAVADDWRPDEAGGSARTRRIGGEIGERDRIGGGAVARLAEHRGQVAVLPLAALQVGGEVELLEHGVDDVAPRRDQEHVVIAARLQELAEPGMEAGMAGAVGGTVGRRVELMLLAQRVRIGFDVEVLQRRRGAACRIQLAEALLVGFQRFHRHVACGHDSQVLADGSEIGLKGVVAGLHQGGILFHLARLQHAGGLKIADQPDGDDGDECGENHQPGNFPGQGEIGEAVHWRLLA